MTELRLALRRLRHSPLFSTFAVVTLAVAIGVTTAVYSLVRTGLKPYIEARSADRIFVVTSQTYRIPQPAKLSWLDFEDVATHVPAFDATVAWASFTAAVSMNGTAEFAVGEMVSDAYFQVVGTRAIRGRALEPADAAPGAPPVAVLSMSMWRSRMQNDPSVLGRTVKIDGMPFQIVGVLPAEFRGLDRPRGLARPEIWIPLSAAPTVASRYARQDRTRRNHSWLSVAGRLESGSARETAQLQVEHLARRLDAAEPLTDRFWGGQTAPRPRNWAARGINDPIDFTEEKSMLRIVLLLPTLVLLIACSNLANFSLSRGIARRSELAVRQALGASRWQLIRGQLVEYSLVAFAGAAGGVFIADRLLVLIASTVETVAGTMPQYRLEAHIDGAVLLAVGGAALLSVLVAGLLPALHLTRRGLRGTIEGDRAAAALPRWRGRGNLIALQVSVSVALLLVSALCVRQLPKLRAAAESGMDLAEVAVVNVPLASRSATNTSLHRALHETVERVRSLPGVASASWAADRLRPDHDAIGPEGAPLRDERTQTTTGVLPVSADYFPTVGIGLSEGRPIAAGDTASSDPVVVLNASLARTIFGSTNVIGKRVSLRNRIGAAYHGEQAVLNLTVVGVAEDTFSRDGTPEGFAYVPTAQHWSDRAELLARARDGVDPASLARQVRDALRRVDPDVAVSFVGRADATDFGPRVALQLFVVWFGTLAILALGFAMSGLYGVLSHVVALRTRELGLRAALGADRRQLIQLVLKDGARPVIEGIVIGFGIAVGVRLGMQPWFEDPVTAVDPVAVVLALVPLLGASLLACYLPARRAAAADPNVALRHL